MALQTHTREIGPHTYTVTTLDALKGRKAFVRLANAIGPVFDNVRSETDFVKNILTTLSEKDVDYFCDLFGPGSTVSGGEYEDRTPNLVAKTFMEHFSGDYLALFEWLAFCVEVNFGSFFGGIGDKVEQFKARLAPVEVKTTRAE